ncbi:conserved hypothetical protein [Lachnoclostridium phytofermentans ISDg]|uniref:DUF2007 domain-containing protein n=1 Tax=Lachnoclostridium phytofermentans (strain ATCC 700394 / DSM 18823 / ISDg) TaxID=357809 RepID=A9KMA9_LACP7|nr:conserved hypothetical protein [Lachnoclostridium phytofermentans ISDg]
MITLFNRKELIITFSMQKQSELRQILNDNNIDYRLKTINRNSPSALNDSRARTGTLGQDLNIAYEYIFYVHKRDYDLAKTLL